VPLKSGYSRTSIEQNIAEMIRAGHPKAQAVAAAYRKARESAKKVKDPHKRNAILRRLSKKS